MKKLFLTRLLLVVFFTFSTCLLNGCVNSQDDIIVKSEKSEEYKESRKVEVDGNEILNTIKDISFQGRELGTDGEKYYSDMLKSKLESYGYNVQFQDFEVFEVDGNVREYIHSDDLETFFNINPTNSTKLKGMARNIIVKSNDFDENKKSLYLFSHYDCTSSTTGVYDNATGVSAVAEIARNLSNYKNDDINIVYAFFSAEEYFKAGSRYYLSQLDELEKNNIIGAINIDMVGYEGFEYEGLSTVGGIEIILEPGTTSNSLETIFNNKVNNKYNVNNEMGGMSDDISFYRLGIPTIYFADKNFITGAEIEDESTEVQLKHLNIKAISTLCEDIIKFVNSISINKSGELDSKL